MRTYEIRPAADGVLWVVYDSATGEPAWVNDRPCVGMLRDDADDLADLLNYMEAKKAEGTVQ